MVVTLRTLKKVFRLLVAQPDRLMQYSTVMIRRATDLRYDSRMHDEPNSSPGTPVTPPEPAMRVLRQFRIVFNAIKTHFRNVERDVGVGGAQLWALSVIEHRPGIGTTELARELDIHQSTASNLVKSLVERGYVVARREAADRRNVALHPLPDGLAILRIAPPPFVGVLPEALEASMRKPGLAWRLTWVC